LYIYTQKRPLCVFLFWSENWGKIITRSKADILEKDTNIKTTLKGETSN
jgi:hypothetical protein